MCVCSLQNVGRGYREENLCLSIGIVRDASPDSITDIKIRKSSQKAPWYCAHIQREERDQRFPWSHGETLVERGGGNVFASVKNPESFLSLLRGYYLKSLTYKEIFCILNVFNLEEVRSSCCFSF